ncbi:hypothetical protein [Larkinella rosea]|uniref:YD repeat-containing protein n=1 Tax=Larkinella rosea TaxID=2025312 RepID=A0A3P1BSN8_9BACT|nr:hypothetical protein [Larkinella rosea]RRB04135.1 hypothetical protein EHT25_11465 [Larkinella rosea]
MKTIPVLLLLLVVLACNRKNEDAILARGQDIRLIRHDYFADPARPATVESTHYLYDANKRIQEITTNRPDGNPDSKLAFRWLNSTTLRIEQYYTNPPWSSTRVSNLPLTLYSYTETVYNADTTISERKAYTLIDKKFDYRSSSRFTYDAQKRIIRRDIYDPTNRLASSATFAYDSRGNVIQGSGEGVYEYDTAPNPYKPVRIDAEISWFMSANNIVGIRSINPTTGIEEVARYRYEYRSDGYPVRMIYPDGRKEEFVYNK